MWVLVLLMIVWSCSEEKKEVVELETDPETTPTIITENVLTLVSDSGVTQYRITTGLLYPSDAADDLIGV
ncbi:MAG: LPS export ABC transporter periplasmic protein LptC, partial [Muribaculaceae bacterium]|nr:LPS export ABC transporter periplasmic protein LptC [Muribaculaceae bacterium]